MTADARMGGGPGQGPEDAARELARLRETVKALYRHAMGDGPRSIDDAMRHGREVCEEDAGAGPPDEE